MSSRKLSKVVGCRGLARTELVTKKCVECEYKNNPVKCELFRRKEKFRRLMEKIN